MAKSPAELLFVFLILMTIVFAGICMVEEVPNSQGFSNPVFTTNTILQAPDGATRHRITIWLGGAFGFLCAPTIITCLMLGLNETSKSKVRSLYILSGVHAALILTLVILYWKSLQHPTLNFLLGFPMPTTFMLYVVGLFPMVFVFLYYIKFDNWIFTAADQKRFHELVKSRRQKQARVD